MSHRGPAAIPTPIGQIVLSMLSVASFLCIVWYLRWFHPEGAGFDVTGAGLIAYHAGRAALVFYMVALSLTAGGIIVMLLGWDPVVMLGSSRKAAILCFFVGATAYGSVYAALGLLGHLSLTTALIGTVPVLLFAPKPVAGLAGAAWREIVDVASSRTWLYRATFIAALLAVAIAVTFFIAMHVVAVLSPDPNIWEHYLHYYRQVLSSGSTQPGEVWHHFFATKPAGFFFVANELSDFFGASVINSVFALAAAVVIADLIDDYCGDLLFGLFGAAIFLIFLGAEWSFGTMFKHHIVVLASCAFAFWVVMRLDDERLGGARPLVIAAMTALSLYMGFYASLIGMIFPTAFGIVFLGNVVLRRRLNLRPLLAFGTAAAAGTLAGFALNYWLTGVPDITPIRFFWALADHAKAEQVLGLGGIEYFLRTNNNVSPPLGPRLLWYFVRFPLAGKWLFVTTAAAVALLAINWRAGIKQSLLALMVRLSAFVIPLSIISVAFQSTGVVYRAGLFTIVFSIIGGVLIWHQLIDEAAIAVGRWAGSSIQGAVRHVLIAALIVAVGAGAGLQALSKIERDNVRPLLRFALARDSLAGAIGRLETKINRGTVGVESSIAAGDLAMYLKQVAPSSRIMRLTYEAGYSNALPGGGVLSEPTEYLVDNPDRLMAMPPEAVASYLKARHIDHFIVSLNAELFTSIAFTQLFNPENLETFFDVGYRDGTHFILTWRQNSAPLPKSLVEGLDFKRAGVLTVPSSPEFARRAIGGDVPIRTIEHLDRIKSDFLSGLDGELNGLSSSLLSVDSRATLTDLWRRAEDHVRGLEIRSLVPIRCWSVACRLGHESPEIVKLISASQVRKRMLDAFLSGFKTRCLEVFGLEVGRLLISTNEREPFGPK